MQKAIAQPNYYTERIAKSKACINSLLRSGFISIIGKGTVVHKVICMGSRYNERMIRAKGARVLPCVLMKRSLWLIDVTMTEQERTPWHSV